MKKRDPNRFPKGWNPTKVQSLIEFYENQSDEDAIAEAEAAYRNRRTSFIEVPIKLLPEVRKLIAKRAG